MATTLIFNEQVYPTMNYSSSRAGLPLKFLLLLGLVLIFNPAVIAQQSPTRQTNDSYVGLRHGPTLPAGLKDEGGGLISDPYKDKTEFGITQVRRGKDVMLWFELLTHRNTKGQAFWEVLDVLTAPPLGKGQLLIFSFCSLKGQPDPEIVAVIDQPQRRYALSQTRFAWRANRSTRKFESIAVKGVTCEVQSDDPN